MSDFNLDQEEEILRDYEAGEFRSVLTPEKKREFEQMAAETFKKDRRINIRISSRDLEAL
jgi:predicted DNA binding CopG/RHH family protein